MLYGIGLVGCAFVGFAASLQGLTRLTLPETDSCKVLEQVSKGLSPDHRSDEVFRPLTRKLGGYFLGEEVDFTGEEVDLRGHTYFQRRVLEEVRSIPRGEVRSYRDVAIRVGSPRAARAVGSVMASNPICIVVPCHRVIASDGGLGGFGGRLRLKQRMLNLETVG